MLPNAVGKGTLQWKCVWLYPHECTWGFSALACPEPKLRPNFSRFHPFSLTLRCVNVLTRRLFFKTKMKIQLAVNNPPTSPHMHTQRSLKGKIEGLSTLQGNSLVLHWTSPSAHNFATSKVALIFTSDLRIGNTDLFCSPNAFRRDFDNSTWLKGCSPWNSPQCPCTKWSWSKNYPFAVVLWWNENSDPLFICVVYSLWPHKKYIREKKTSITVLFF